jgi:hypothetical protein
MARQVDYDALVAKLEATDVFVAIQDDEPILLACCMDCDATILKAIGAEVGGSELHLAILEHDCSEPTEPVVVDHVGELDEYLDGISITPAEPPAVEPALLLPPMPAEADVPPRILQIADRCDRCHVQAWVRVETPAGPVDLCARDYRASELTVMAAGYAVIDERAFLNARPSLSATPE